MNLNDFKDCLFNILNDTDELPIADIEVNDASDEIKIILNDHTQFMINIAPYGTRFILK